MPGANTSPQGRDINMTIIKSNNSGTNLFTSNLSEIDILYRNKVKYADMPKISCSTDAEKILRTVWDHSIDHVEVFYILCLNRANKVLGWAKISSGGVEGTVADPKVIFQVAIKSNCSSLILCHNHPSGNTEPSEADIRLTRNLKEAGDLLRIKVLDHIILTSESYYSFADENMI